MRKPNILAFMGSVDTLSLKCNDNLSAPMPEVEACVTVTQRVTDDPTVSRVKINPNNLLGPVDSYSMFKTVFDTITADAGIVDYDLIRFDFAMDSEDPEFYEKNFKLFLFLIQSMRTAYPSKKDNAYITVGFDLKKRSIDLKRNDFQISFYDKEKESGGRDRAFARLEIRSVKLPDNDIQNEFFGRWKRRLTKTLDNVEKGQQAMNDILVETFHDGAKKGEFKTIAEFLRRYQDWIFTRKQCIDLIERIDGSDHKTATMKTDNFKKNNRIQFYTKADMIRLVQAITKTISVFFEN